MPKKNFIWVVAILAATVVTVWVTRDRPTSMRVNGQPRRSAVDEAIDKIRNAYYLPIDDGDPLMRGALGGMVKQLDEFSSYFPPSRAPAFQRRMDGVAEGLGLQVTSAGGRVKVAHAAANSPARAAALRPGMEILTIDGLIAGGLDPRELRSILHPPPGESVELTLRTKSRKRRSVKITAGRYNVQSVAGLLRHSSGQWQWMLDPEHRVAYVRICEFVDDTVGRLLEALRLAGPIDALILDVRANPGGKSEVAVQMADLFLRDGLIVKMVGRAGVKAVHEAHSAGTRPDMTVVVLVDGRTASGAELLAGALRARHRAVLVGTRTRGKGCIQSMIDLGNMGLVNLTTAQFVFAGGKPITRHKDAKTWGIEPHDKVAIAAGSKAELGRLRILAEYGPPQSATTRPRTPTTAAARAAIVGKLLRADAQLRRASELIRKQRVAGILTRAAEAARKAATQPAEDREAADK